MRILALDIGGGTQDILLFDSTQTVENCVRMIMPSPTTTLARNIRAATRAGQPIFLTGVNMGGGPSKGALMGHLKAGLAAYATPDAATTFNDDVEEVANWGVKIVESRPEGKEIAVRETRDLNLAAVERALEAFEVESDLDAVAVAVLDHGAAPRGVSDRAFRFQHLEATVQKRRRLFDFAYLADDIPAHLTRMKAVAQSMDRDLPLLLMDTPVAAAIGATLDKEVSGRTHRVIVNIGNFHTLAFHLEGDTILGFFEHHTGLLNTQKIDSLVQRLVRGDLTNQEVFADHGHGSLVIESRAEVPFVAVTGPRRRLLSGSQLHPYFAAPYGDMMITGCFGLVRAFGYRREDWGNKIEDALK